MPVLMPEAETTRRISSLVLRSILLTPKELPVLDYLLQISPLCTPAVLLSARPSAMKWSSQ